MTQEFGTSGADTAREPVSRTSPALALRLFGAFALSVHGQDVPALTRSARTLIALLALRGHSRPLDRERVCALLWPESDSTAARYNLRRTLTEVRAALGPEADRLAAPQAGPRTLRLDLVSGSVYCDANAFDAAVARGTEESVETASAIYDESGGVLLEGERGDWILAERDARTDALLLARERLARTLSERGDTSGALRHLRAAVRIDPARETSVRELMRVLAEIGQTASALAAYRSLDDLLRRTGPSRPEAETTAFYRQLREQAQQMPPESPEQNRAVRAGGSGGDAFILPATPVTLAFPRNLPRPLTRLVGRETDIADIAALLGGGPAGHAIPARLVTLAGPGGIGKTRLACAAAETAAPNYESGVCFVDFAPVSDGRQLGFATAHALRLNVPAQIPGIDSLRFLYDTLRDSHGLLIFDNCEHVTRESARLALQLLHECPHLTILATSREPLHVPGEIVWRVPRLSHDDGVRLFQERASDNRSARMASDVSPKVTSGDPAGGDTAAAYLGRIVSRLDGIPLAIEMAAARTRSLTVGEIAARLDDVFRLLAVPGGDLLPRHQTLRATLDWSYGLLDPAEQTLLARLSVFAGGWTLAAAEAVCAGSETGQDVMTLLASLVEKSLVQFAPAADDDAASGAGRYSLLETIRQYADEKLVRHGETASVRDRHLSYYRTLAEAAKPHLFRSTVLTWYIRLEAEHDNLRAALARCAANADGRNDASLAGLRLSTALQRFWLIRGYQNEGREHLQRALAPWRAMQAQDAEDAPVWELGSFAGKMPETPGSPERGETVRAWSEAAAGALTAASILANAQGDYQAALPLLDASLALSREIGDKRGIASSLSVRGTSAFGLGNFAEARRLHREALLLYRELDDPWNIASSLNNLGTAASSHGDYADARTYHEESLAIRRTIGDPGVLATSLHNLGVIAYRQGDFPAARRLNEESLAIKRELGDRNGIADSLNNLATLASDQGDYAAALVMQEECLALSRELGSREKIANALNNLGVTFFHQGNLARARAYFEDDLHMRRRIGDKLGLVISLNNLGETAELLGEHASARACHEESLALSREIGNRRGTAMSLMNLSRAASAGGDHALARTLLRESLSLNHEIGDKEGCANALGAFALLALSNGDTGDIARAVRLWASADSLRSQVGLAQSPADRDSQAAHLTKARTALGDTAFSDSWAEGQSAGWDTAAAWALQ